MSTKPLESILYREFSKAQAEQIIEIASDVLQELVNFASNALVRCATSTTGNENEDLAILSLYRNVMEMTDGIEVLVSQSCAIPAIPLVRSSFESLISMLYIVEEDSKYVERSLAWLIDYIHQRLALYESLDPNTARGQDFQQSISLDDTVRTLQLPSQADINNAIQNLQNLLAKPQLQVLNQDFLNLRGAKKWHRLYGGPDNIRELARHVGRIVQYDFLYRYWSRVSHGHDFAPFIVKTPDGDSGIRGIRDSSELKSVANFAATFMLGATRIIIGKFRPDEDIRTWYEREVQPKYTQLYKRP
jgi:hypothetical protein